MIVAVFGGNGFIGSHLVKRLLAEGHHVRIFDRAFAAMDELSGTSRVTFFRGDFPTQDDFSGILEGCDVVFQLISTTLPNCPTEESISDIEGNLIPMLRLLNQMRTAGVSRLIFPSSGGTVYGQSLTTPIEENHPTNPIVSYGATKLAIEKYLAIFQASFGLRSTCLRISNPYGPGFRFASPQGAVGAFLHRATRDMPITIFGDGKIVRDYLYIDDLMDAMMKTIDYNGDISLFNISSGTGTSLLELIEEIELATGRSIEVNHMPSRSFDVKINILANRLAASELGWSPKTTLRQGIKLTAAWLQNIQKSN